MNIGVSGASGHLGSATVRELKARLGAQANIVAISRSPDKIAELGVETRAGDFDKPETLTGAFRGLDKFRGDARLLASMFEERRYAAGAEICHLGDTAGHVFVVAEGAIEVWLPLARKATEIDPLTALRQE